MKRGLYVGFIFFILFLASVVIFHLPEETEKEKPNYTTTIEHTRKIIPDNIMMKYFTDPIRNKGFIENKGQINNIGISYYIDIGDLRVGFSTSKIIFYNISGQVTLEVSFKNSNSITPYGDSKRENYNNYYFGSEVYVNVGIYNQIIYYNIYEGIDLRYYLTKVGLKYEFIVHPGADPDSIQVFSDSKVTTLDSLVSYTKPRIKITDSELYVHQNNDKIRASFVPVDAHSYGFDVWGYDISKILVIDPLLLNFSTYIGGSAADLVYDLAIDESRNVYAVGETVSTDFPLSSAINITNNGA